MYEAYDAQLDRAIALKVAKPELMQSELRVQRFLREARSAANLRHPHIVPVFDSGSDAGASPMEAAARTVHVNDRHGCRIGVAAGRHDPGDEEHDQRRARHTGLPLSRSTKPRSCLGFQNAPPSAIGILPEHGSTVSFHAHHPTDGLIGSPVFGKRFWHF